jgi:hypothetical protein
LLRSSLDAILWACAAVTVHSAKYGAFFDIGCLEPLAKRSDRARVFVLAKNDRDLFAGLFLIGF